MERCRVDDTLPEHTIIGLPRGWVDTDVGRLYTQHRFPSTRWYVGALDVKLVGEPGRVKEFPSDHEKYCIRCGTVYENLVSCLNLG